MLGQGWWPRYFNVYECISCWWCGVYRESLQLRQLQVAGHRPVLREDAHRDAGLAKGGQWQAPNMNAVAIFFGGELLVGIVVASIRGQHGD